MSTGQPPDQKPIDENTPENRWSQLRQKYALLATEVVEILQTLRTDLANAATYTGNNLTDLNSDLASSTPLWRAALRLDGVARKQEEHYDRETQLMEETLPANYPPELEQIPTNLIHSSLTALGATTMAARALRDMHGKVNRRTIPMIFDPESPNAFYETHLATTLGGLTRYLSAEDKAINQMVNHFSADQNLPGPGEGLQH